MHLRSERPALAGSWRSLDLQWTSGLDPDLAMGQNPVTPVNIPILTKIGSKMGGEFTYPQNGIPLVLSFDPQPFALRFHELPRICRVSPSRGGSPRRFWSRHWFSQLAWRSQGFQRLSPPASPPGILVGRTKIGEPQNGLPWEVHTWTKNLAFFFWVGSF